MIKRNFKSWKQLKELSSKAIQYAALEAEDTKFGWGNKASVAAIILGEDEFGWDIEVNPGHEDTEVEDVHFVQGSCRRIAQAKMKTK